MFTYRCNTEETTSVLVDIHVVHVYMIHTCNMYVNVQHTLCSYVCTFKKDTCTCTCTYLHVHVHVHTCTQICTYIHAYIQMYILTCRVDQFLQWWVCL